MAGLRLLKIESARVGFAHPFSVMDEDDQKRLVEEALSELDFSTISGASNN